MNRFRAKATKARQAQSRLKLLARLEPVDAIVDDEVREIAIPSPAKPLSPPIIAFDNVAVGYGDTPVLRRLHLRIDDDDRIALIGANGNGKSTFAKLLAGRMAAMDGRITRADKLDIAYFAQHQLDELQCAREPVRSPARADAGRARSQGARAARRHRLLRRRRATPRSRPSRAARRRACCSASPRCSGPHLVILDEPTNHLDIDSRAALIEAINDYAGAVVLISHDRYLIDACADRLWLVADGTVAPFDGDLDEYRRRVLSDRRGEPGGAGKASRDDAETRASRTDQRRAAAERRAELAPLRARITARRGGDRALDAGARRARHGAGAAGPLRRSGPRHRPRQGARRGRRGARRRRDGLARRQHRV